MYDLLESAALAFRVRMILALGYWVLPNIFHYWVIWVLGNTFVGCHTQYC